VGQVKNSPASPAQDYRYIDTREDLETFARQARRAEIIALDIEGDSMFHFQEKVCLVQMAANGQTVVIDPLTVQDLSAIKPILENNDIPKVIHGADYDIRSVYRDFGIAITNLFDTQLASMYMGWTETSLEAVVARHFGVKLDKKFQKKNWSQRPLPKEMVTYAASDVAYLIPLARHLTRELEGMGRLPWVTEECRLLCGVRHAMNNDGPMFLKFKGAGRLEPRQLAVLEALLQTRNAIARQKDRPLFKVIGNSALKKIALTMPTSLKQLEADGTLSDKQYDMYGKAVMEAVRNARRMPKDQLPIYPRHRSPKVPRKVPARVKALRAWRDAKAEELDLNEALLFNRALIKAIAADNPATKASLAEVDGIHQWQVDAFGDDILSVLK
jgi:ribonuclease D